jgi:hypothetical protein
VPTGIFTPGKRLDGFGQALRQRHAAAANSDQRQICGPAAFFHDFVRQTLQRPVHFFGGKQLAFFDDSHWRHILTQRGLRRENHAAWR